MATPPRFIDTHAHLQTDVFDADRGEVVERMRSAGVFCAINVGCDLEDSQNALRCARTFGLYASAGIHPHEAKSASAGFEAALRELLDDPLTVAVGETGLDYYYDHSPRETQREVLRAEIRLARELHKPVIFHHRDAFLDFTEILRDEWHDGMHGVVHCFTGDAGEAKTYIEEFGLSLGAGGILTFKNAGKIREAMHTAGIERILLETDCPFLAPVPHRGKRNEPAFLIDTARVLAEILHIGIEEIAERTTANALTLFGLPAQQ